MPAQLMSNGSYGKHPSAAVDERAPLLLHHQKANQKATDDEINALPLGIRDWLLIVMISCASFLNARLPTFPPYHGTNRYVIDLHFAVYDSSAPFDRPRI